MIRGGEEIELPEVAAGRECDPRVREIVDLAELYRLEACRRLDSGSRGMRGQFLTPPPVALKLASMFSAAPPRSVAILEPGAGVGTLAAAAVGRLLAAKRPPESVRIVAYEIEEAFLPLLSEVLGRLCGVMRGSGVEADYEVRPRDFVAAAVASVSGDLFDAEGDRYTHAILNPPFRKINTGSEERVALQRAGIECTNLYAAFAWLSLKLLRPGGELAAITPRSFCNGPYFRPFRAALLEGAALDRFALIEERDLAFGDDGVLQETVLFHAERGAAQPATVAIERAFGRDLADSTERSVPFAQFAHPDDPESFFHIVGDEHGAGIKREMEGMPCALEDLGLRISTGRVVDFRASEHLRAEPEPGAAPLIYPVHLREGDVRWPVSPSRKPNAIAANEETRPLLVPMGHYVLLKRFTSKEEKRRVVATVFSPSPAFGGAAEVGFENHLNYYHDGGRPLEPELARGLACFLNSSALDDYFRQFSGHTQVNATDLRRLRYPSRDQLLALGRRAAGLRDPARLDAAVAEVLNFMPASNLALEASRRIEEGLAILKSIGAPREQQNERSALVLLALAGIRPETPWKDASAPLLGITEMMDFFRDAYGKSYAPNTRETVRRFTVHQFIQIGLLVPNPDKPGRPVNSPHNVYQLESAALSLLKLYGTPAWLPAIEDYKAAAEKLAALRQKEREMTLVPVTLPTGEVIQLTAGGQNAVMKAIVEEFCPRFTPGGHILYLGDAGDKWLVKRPDELAALGVSFDEHGKMPDVVVHYGEKNWLVLVEAVTSHGPMNLKRRNELKSLFAGSKAGLVFVTAFPTRAEMVRFLGEISWETEVWVADAPSHMIHFNGERFLGPYES